MKRSLERSFAADLFADSLGEYSVQCRTAQAVWSAVNLRGEETPDGGSTPPAISAPGI